MMLDRNGQWAMRIESSVRAQLARLCVPRQIGPFLAMISPYAPVPWLNYAVPTGPLVPGPAFQQALDQLVGYYEAHQRMLRFEFLAGRWVRLPELLEQAGLRCEGRLALLACEPGMLRPVAAPGVAVRFVTPDDALWAVQALIEAAFGESDLPPEAAAVLRGRSVVAPADHAEGMLIACNLDAGIRYVLATYGGEPCGVGAAQAAGGVAELTTIGCRPAFRRRGVARTLTSVLAETLFSEGCDLVYLSAADAGARALYHHLGFEDCDTLISYTR